MRMSEGVEWGIHCLTVLAALPPGATLPGKALAELHGVSESYLLKHLQALAAAGLCESLPGPRGGYRLARPADRITLLDAAEAIEGPEPAFRCSEIRQRGPCAGPPSEYLRPCAINAAMLRAELAWRRALEAQTVADLLGQVIPTLSPERQEALGQWAQSNVRSQRQ
jgi:Rrf2 family protein